MQNVVFDRKGAGTMFITLEGIDGCGKTTQERICPINGDQPPETVTKEIQRIFEAMERVGR